MKLIRRVLVWLAFAGGLRREPIRPVMRVAFAMVWGLAYWRGRTAAYMWRRYGIEVFGPPPPKRLLSRRE